MDIKKRRKNAENFVCEKCNFNCSKQSEWERHILRPKHKKNINGYKKTPKNINNCDYCGKIYKYYSGLWKHNQICNNNLTNNNIIINDINDINDINKDSVKPYNVLKQVYSKHSMQDVSNVGLFKLVRNKYSENNLKTAWLNNWEYHASFSPIWLDRIKRGGGYVNYTYKRIEFINDECAEVFYAEFGYEPDEQPKNIYDKAIGLLSSATASIMYNNKGLFIPFQEELDELEFV